MFTELLTEHGFNDSGETINGNPIWNKEHEGNTVGVVFDNRSWTLKFRGQSIADGDVRPSHEAASLEFNLAKFGLD